MNAHAGSEKKTLGIFTAKCILACARSLCLRRKVKFH